MIPLSLSFQLQKGLAVCVIQTASPFILQPQRALLLVGDQRAKICTIYFFLGSTSRLDGVFKVIIRTKIHQFSLEFQPSAPFLLFFVVINTSASTGVCRTQFHILNFGDLCSPLKSGGFLCDRRTIFSRTTYTHAFFRVRQLITCPIDNCTTFTLTLPFHQLPITSPPSFWRTAQHRNMTKHFSGQIRRLHAPAVCCMPAI